MVKKEASHIEMMVEIPKGSMNKYEYDIISKK
jgi:inorganic pyrophosphatase